MDAGQPVPPTPPDSMPVSAPRPLFRAVGVAANVMARLGRARATGARVVPVDRELDMVVREVGNEARDVVSLRLTRADDTGEVLPRWWPGAHLDLVLPSGRVRQYSLCGDPSDRHSFRVAVRHISDGGGGSREVHSLRPGDRVRVRGPREAFPLVRAPGYLFLAGGIGITPILPMVRAVAAAGADWRFVYVGRDRATMPFLAELAEIPHSRDRVVIRPDDEHGGPAAAAKLLEHAPPGPATGYLCGPPPMIAAVRAAMDDSAHRLTALHVERFAAPPVVGGTALTVHLARTRATLDVPADRSVLEVVRERLPQVPYSCQQGFCGTCRTKVLDGEVEHRDRVLTEPERRDTMTICVSRGRGDRLVLDL
ncbi:PDR/VanB family oxidoreductase [Pseudonocardia eucalypti]|uniref:PDR/VanB family oxidoreductase n=2 Tax=Pseudonocardia eucalypti TaxID=648755 RepID=A0ABP9QFA9_9PSEU